MVRAIVLPITLSILLTAPAWAADPVESSPNPQGLPWLSPTTNAASDAAAEAAPRAKATARRVPATTVADAPMPDGDASKTPVIVPELQGDLVQPIGVGVTGWVQAWPAYNHHLILSLATPIVQSPWQLLIDAVPTLGTGSATVSKPVILGPVVVLPALGLRYYGVNGTNTDGFLYGPQGRLGMTVPILPWLSVTGKLVYAPWLQLMNKPGSGSFVEMNGSLVAHVGRMTYLAGYTAMIVDATGAGLWPAKGTYMGGPTMGVAFSF